MAGSETSVVLLDFGGVLLRLHDPARTFGIAGDAASFNERWLLSPAVRSLESGVSSIDAFARRAVHELGLDYDAAEFLRRFESWPDVLYDGITELLDDIGSRFTLALLSNTNPVHWNRPDIGPVLEPRFDKLFLSWQTGHLKPDADAFDNVTQFYGVAPSAIFFVDDNPLNVQAAARCGLQATLARGDAELRNAVVAAGLL